MLKYLASAAAGACLLAALSCTSIPPGPLSTLGGTATGSVAAGSGSVVVVSATGSTLVTVNSSVSLTPNGTISLVPGTTVGLNPGTGVILTPGAYAIASVSVTPNTATLSVPPENPGLASAGFVTTLQLDARSIVVGGGLLDNDLIWTSSNPELVQVDSKGLVSTVRSSGGAKPTLPGQPVILTATSRQDPTKSAAVSIAVTDDATAIIQLQ